MYVNYCHQCGHPLSSADTDRCEQCAWLRCECGACGCGYEQAAGRPLLATVPPGWTGGAPHHAVALPVGTRPSRMLALAVLALGVALLAAAGLLGTRYLTARDFAWVVPGSEPVEPAPPTVAAPAANAPALSGLATVVPAPVAVPGDSPSAAAAQPVPAVADPARPFESPAATSPSATLPAVLYVSNTDGQGAFIRSAPRDGQDTRIFAWRDGTELVPLETRAVPEGAGSATWVRVRDPRGQEGWIRQAYLSPRR